MPEAQLTLSIAGRTVGGGAPALVVAELSANHHRDLGRAKQLVKAAHVAGADAVKVQTFTADSITLDADGASFEISGSSWSGRRLHDLYAEAALPWEWHRELQALARDLGLVFFSSPFDGAAVTFLEELEVPAYKIASFEIVDIPLIRRVAATGRPMIISTGMATLDEIDEAFVAAREGGASEIALLRCTSAYPAQPDELNLRTIGDLSKRYGVPVGLSDHTLTSTAAVVAVSLGAALVEKHLTLSRSAGGPDAAFSVEPLEFGELVTSIREAEASLGTVSYAASAREQENRQFRRSLYAVEDIRCGELFTPTNVRSIRPGDGLHPRHLDEILGKRAMRDLPRGTPLDRAAVDEG